MNIALYLNQIAPSLALRLNLKLYTNHEWHGFHMCEDEEMPTLVDEISNQVVVDLLVDERPDTILVQVTGPDGSCYEEQVGADKTYSDLENTIQGLIRDANWRDEDE